MQKSSLHYKFRLWTILLVIVPSLLVMIIYTNSQIKLLREKNLEIISQRVSAQERLITRWMDERTNILHKITQLEAFRTLDEVAMKNILNIIQDGSNNFDGIVYVDKNGVFKLSTTNSPPLIGKHYVGDYHLTTDTVSDVFRGQFTGTPLIDFSSPIFDYEGNFQGIITGAVKTKNLVTLLEDNHIGKTGEVILVSRTGLLLSESRNVNFLIKKGFIEKTAVMNITLPNDALQNIRFGETGTATWTDYNGEKVLSAYHDMPKHHWTLIGKIDETEIFTPIYKQLLIMTSITLLLILLLLPLSTLLTNRITRPLEWLVGQATIISSKNHELVGYGLPTKKIPYELLMLCHAFVNMNHKIQRTLKLLRENEFKLKTKISARTIALSSMNNILQTGIIKHQALNTLLENSKVALLINETRYKNLFSHMHSGFSYYKVIFDNANIPIELECITVNAAYEKSFQKTAAQLIGKLRSEFIPSIDKDNFNWQKAFIDVALTRKPRNFTQYLEHNEHWYSISAYSPTKGYVSIISEDITDYIALKKEVARIDRLNLIENMAAGLAHEIRNPLTVVKGYLQYFKKKIPASLHEQLDLLFSELARIETIINDFLSIAKKKTTTLELDDLNAIINGIMPLLLTTALKRSMNIKLKLSDELSTCLLAKQEIKQLILNLAMNGLDAMKKDGTLTIETKQQGTAILLCITDCGSGIPKNLQQKIFDPFFTMKDEGTGLGLAVCASIVARHNAKIDITSEEGIGTCFTITFQTTNTPA